MPSPKIKQPRRLTQDEFLDVFKTKAHIRQLLEQHRLQGPPPDWIPPVTVYAKNWLAYFENQMVYQNSHRDDAAVKAALGDDPFYVPSGKAPWYVDFMLANTGDIRYYHGMFFNAGKPIGYYVNFTRNDNVSGDNQLLTYFSFSFDEVAKESVPLGKGALFYNKAKSGQNGLLIQHIQVPGVHIQLAAGKQDFQAGKISVAGEGPYNILIMMIDGAQFGSANKGKIILKRPL